ncbi:SGNH hydrolase-type esterase domain-containing protein [Amylocarpus encephaloides]|uniref:SGNH hydrolase-type esterase domain-containing protein n=1 Tax=Amylocarpus encephaloides TaxID=45428 RepID=A0A9P7YDM8_9HELO|nr:SGNH hydrolase-type esterase domain-containing protein [Amylocarpus encephaloides]
MASRVSLTLLALCLLAFCSGIDGRQSSHSKRRPSNHKKWIPTWGSMPQLTEPANLPPPPFNQSGQVFFNSTIRQTIKTSVGGSQIRLRFSNAFGIYDLPITAVTVSLSRNRGAGINAIQTKTLKSVKFSGSSNYIVPQGALVVSDPIDFAVPAQTILTVTMYLAEGQQSNFITSHPGSRAASWLTQGNQVSSESLSGASLASVAHWYFLSNVEVLAPRDSKAFAIVGDSITDGRGSDTNKNNRWPDLLLTRLQKRPSRSNIAFINQAAGGNRVLYDGLGPNALSRIDRDVLSQSSVQYAMIFEGVNDIGTTITSPSAQRIVGDRLIAAYKQMATRLRTADIEVWGATITPFSAPANYTGQPYSDPERERTRQRVNRWIREGGNFDEVVDFDRILRDEKVPSQLKMEYNSGDYLHPNVAGYQRLADSFPLHIF